MAEHGLEAASRLRRAAERLQGDDPDLAWLRERLHAYLRAPEALDLGTALGLTTPPGGLPWWRQERLMARDELLRRLAADLPGSTSRRAHALAEHLRRYGATGWPHDRRRGAPLPDTAERRLLYQVFRLDPAPPMGVRRLIEILSA